MSARRALLGAVIVLGFATLPAGAATFNIAFDLESNGSGVDYTGTFDAPAGGGQLTAFNVPAIDGTLYDTVDPSWFPATYDSVLNQLSGVVLTQLFDFAALIFLGDQWARGFYTPDCLDNDDCAVGNGGTYAISAVSAVPIPAALPLFAAGLGAMGFMGWRRKRKAFPSQKRKWNGTVCLHQRMKGLDS